MSGFMEKKNYADSEKMIVFPLNEANHFEFKDGQHHCHVTVSTGEVESLPAGATHFIVVQQGRLRITLEETGQAYELNGGQYASLPGAVRIEGQGHALIVSSIGYGGVALVGGPMEERGRLRYIDGCTSSLLVSPPVRGEPCLNLLCLPAHTHQTMHEHPSLRVGLILSGNGRCDTHHGLLDFKRGTGFLLPPGTAHSFQSQEEDMRIVIFHPDSDSGPTHTDHTMLNRTFVAGKSAQQLTELHTREEVAA